MMGNVSFVGLHARILAMCMAIPEATGMRKLSSMWKE